MIVRLGAALWAIGFGVSACSSRGFHTSEGVDGSSPRDAGDLSTSDGPAKHPSVSVVREASVPDVSAPAPREGGIADAFVGPPDALVGPADAFTSPSDAAVADAQIPDAGVRDAGPRGFCERTRATFCADFDRVTSVSDGWTRLDVTGGSLVDFDVNEFTSPTRSFRSRLALGVGQTGATAKLTRVVKASSNHSTLEFNCRIASIGTTGQDWFVILGRVFRNDGRDGAALLADSTGTWSVLTATGDTLAAKLDLPAPPPFHKFVRITMDVTWNDTAGSLRIAFDGVTVLTKPTFSTADTQQTQNLGFEAGFTGSVANPAGEMSIDDVVFDVR